MSNDFYSRRVRRIGAVAAVAASALVAVAGMAAPSVTRAQDGATVITIAVQDNQKELFNNTILPDFNKANPNIIVQTVSATNTRGGGAASDVTSFLDNVQTLVSQSDVVLVGSNDVSAESTRAGYFLNIQPLVDGDTALNQADFYPTILKAFQWDQGMWALPLNADATVLSYDAAAFDKAGVNYPTAKWRLSDIIDAAKKLTIIDQSGKVLTPGLELFQGNNDIPLYMSLLNKPLYDANAIPNPPALDTPEVQALLNSLPDLFAVIPLQSATFGQAPIQIGSIRQLAFGRIGAGNNAARTGVLLPGGHAYLNVNGAAVSSSTQHPEAAYAFAKFLTTRSDLSGASYPARQSLTSSATTGGFFQRITPDVKQLYSDAIAHGYTAADRRYYDFLQKAITDMRTNKTDAKTAIATAQSNATAAEQTALTRKADASKVAVIATPVPTVAPNAGITLKFGFSSFGPIQHKAEMQALADQFVAQNPGVVGRVDITAIGGGPGGNGNSTANFDAYYLPYSNVPNTALDSILSLDPYLTSDKTYDKQDFLNGALNQVTRDNKIWALPMNVQPTVMYYDPVAFGNSGATKPVVGWDISAFNDSLKALAPNVESGNPPFTAQSDYGSSLLMLMASYGGLPIDFRTNPVTINFTDPTNTSAMQQVLDLAKNKLIDYKALGNVLGFSVNRSLNNPVYSQELGSLNLRGLVPGQSGPSNAPTAKNYAPVTFPKGSKYQMMAYSVGTLYINASTQNADAAYRWIALLAQHPELTNAMPARNSLLADPKLDTTFGVGLAGIYREVGKILNDSNTIGSPSLVGGFANISNLAVQHWLFEAWDNYVLNGKDLATSLFDAQGYASTFLTCFSTVPAFDPAQEKYSDYTTQIINCVVKADPRLSNLRGLAGG